MTVTLKCAAREAMVSVSEPEICSYTCTIATPVVCESDDQSSHGDAAISSVIDEL